MGETRKADILEAQSRDPAGRLVSVIVSPYPFITNEWPPSTGNSTHSNTNQPLL